MLVRVAWVEAGRVEDHEGYLALSVQRRAVMEVKAEGMCSRWPCPYVGVLLER